MSYCGVVTAVKYPTSEGRLPFSRQIWTEYRVAVPSHENPIRSV